MENATQRDQSSPSFGNRWAMPILFGCTSGVLFVYIMMDPLVKQLGDVLGGALCGLASIGLGFAVSVAVNLSRQLLGRLLAESGTAVGGAG